MKVTKRDGSDPENPKKSTNAQINQRVMEVQKLLMQGHTRSYILKYAAKWRMSDSMISQYIKKATDIIKEINELEAEAFRAIIKRKQFKLLEDAEADDDKAIRRQVMMDLAKVGGLLEDNVQVSIRDERDPELAKASDEDLDALLKARNET